MNDQTPAEPEAPDTAAAPEKARPKRRLWRRLWPLLVLVIVLVLLAAAGYGGWQGWQWYQTEVQTRQAQRHALESGVHQARAQAKTLRADLATASAAADQANARAKVLQKQLAALDGRLESLEQTVSGGRRGVQLAIVEQLLLLANDEVLVERDPAAAHRALVAADRHLAGLKDPRLFAVRKQLAEELGELAAVHEPDLAGAAIALGHLIDAVPDLPFRSAPHSVSAPTPGADSGHQDHESPWTRGWERIGQGLSALFRIQRHDRPVEPLLPAAEQRLVGAVLALRLDGARAALVRRDTVIYRSELKAAEAWVQRYYRKDAPATQSMQKQLRELASVDLSPALPDISGSLDLLRKQQAAAAE